MKWRSSFWSVFRYFLVRMILFKWGQYLAYYTHESFCPLFFVTNVDFTCQYWWCCCGGDEVVFFFWRSRCSGTTPPTWSYVFAIVVLETVFWQKGVFEKEHKHLDWTSNGWEWKERESQVSPPVMQTVWCPLQCGVQSSYIETLGWEFLNTTLQRGKVLHRECGIA